MENPELKKNDPAQEEIRHQNAINNYLSGYQMASTPAQKWQSTSQNRSGGSRLAKNQASTGAVKGKRLQEKPTKQAQEKQQKIEEVPKKKHSIGGLIGLAIVALLAAGICLYCVFLKKDTSHYSEIVQSEFNTYVNFAEDALSVSPEFKTKGWQSSDEALAAFVNILNPSVSSEWKFTYTPGASFAEGKTDPWGTPYFITAKQINYERDNGYPYEFYITSAGENGIFDTVNLVLDNDDISTMLFSMEKYVGMNGKLSIIDPDSIDNNTQASVPITFDMGEGTGGTAFLEAIPGENLPDISVPEREGYVFNGYYEFANGVGVRYWDKEGKGCVPSPFESGATVYAAWELAPVSTEESTTDSSETSVEEPESNEAPFF